MSPAPFVSIASTSKPLFLIISPPVTIKLPFGPSVIMVVKFFSFKPSIASSILSVPVRANASSRLPKTKSIPYESIFSNFSRKP